jgi:hypothetical protein
VVGQGHAPAALPPGKRAGTLCRGGWRGPRDRLDEYGKEDISYFHWGPKPMQPITGIIYSIMGLLMFCWLFLFPAKDNWNRANVAGENNNSGVFLRQAE